jgi:hypothetical protein
MMGRRLLSRLVTTTKGRVLLIWNWAALRFEGVKQSSMASQHAAFLAAGIVIVGATSPKGGGLPHPRTGAERAGKKPTLANYDLQVVSIASGISGQIRVKHQSQMSKLEADRK